MGTMLERQYFGIHEKCCNDYFHGCNSFLRIMARLLLWFRRVAPESINVATASLEVIFLAIYRECIIFSQVATSPLRLQDIF